MNLLTDVSDLSMLGNLSTTMDTQKSEIIVRRIVPYP